MKNYNKIDAPKYLKYLFHPQNLNISDIQDEKDEDILTTGGVRLGCRFFLADIKFPTILYFHGNGEKPADYDAIAPLYMDAGVNLFVATYRGYGRSNGTPSVENMMSDAPIILKYLQVKQVEMEMTGPVFIMGRSIGSAVAIELCAAFADHVKGMILESGFADTIPLLEKIGLDMSCEAFEEEDGFNNLDKIAKIKMPTLILHGSSDHLIPVNQAEKLQSFSGARTKKFFVIPGADHNSTIAAGGEHYFTTIKGFIDDVTGESTWRKRRKKYRDKR